MAITGLDIGSSQSTLSISAAKSAGIDFVIVKAGGANVQAPGYVAPFYTAQIDRCISAGMPHGHYWVIGNRNVTSPTAQADYFCNHLHKFNRNADIVALDNEPLDDNTAFWNDADTATFINRCKSNLSIDGTRFWVYGQASLWTSGDSGPWPKTIATGTRFWVAYWGSNDGARHAPPNLSAYIPSIHAQQYTSKGTVAGVQVDKDYSAYTVDELFNPPGGTGASGGTSGGGGSTLGPGNVLSEQDRADLADYIDRAISGKVNDIAQSTWEHSMDSAIDGGAHWIQTYAAWAQRDLATIAGDVSLGDPEFILAKETSTATIYALNPQKGTKRAITAGQFNVLAACNVSYKVVADGSLAAFTTVTG